MNKILFLMVFFVACGFHNDPLPLTPEPGYPCGRPSKQCLEMDNGVTKATGFCCYNSQVCGGTWPSVGCPPEYCCDEMEGTSSSQPRALRVSGKQWKAGAP